MTRSSSVLGRCATSFNVIRVRILVPGTIVPRMGTPVNTCIIHSVERLFILSRHDLFSLDHSNCPSVSSALFASTLQLLQIYRHEKYICIGIVIRRGVETSSLFWRGETIPKRCGHSPHLWAPHKDTNFITCTTSSEFIDYVVAAYRTPVPRRGGCI